MNLSLSDLESPYGENTRRGEVVPLVWRRPLPPAERWRRAAERSLRDFVLICDDTVYGNPLPLEEAPRAFPRLVDPE